jgi:hypothetical protein
MLDRANSDRRNAPDNGSNLTLRKVVDEHRGCYVDVWGDPDLNYYWLKKGYKGYVIPFYLNRVDGGSTSMTAPSVPSEPFLTAQGATLVSRALPDTPQSGLGVFLRELKEGLPRASVATFRSLRNFHRGAADDFLNFQFGWLPFVRDLQDFVRVLKGRNEIIRQYVRDSGRPVRRRRALPPATSTVSYPTNGGQWFSGSVVSPGIYPGRGSFTIEQSVETWFSGEFTYFLPVSDDTMGKLEYYERLSDRLLGLSLTPDLLWEIAPWSWLVDWFTNVGDVLQNVSSMAQHGTVMRYGYVCYKVQRRYTFEVMPGLISEYTFWNGTRALPASYSRTFTHMYRRKANPYGFGVTWESLNGTQWAILAALGLTRGQQSGSTTQD